MPTYATSSNCGSDTVNDALIGWCIGLLLYGLVYCGLYISKIGAISDKLKTPSVERLRKLRLVFKEELSNQSGRQNRNIILAGRFLDRLSFSSTAISAIVLFIFIVEYGFQSYSVSDCRILWTLSFGVLRGTVSGAVSFVSFIAVILATVLITAKFITAPDDFLITLSALDSTAEQYSIPVSICIIWKRRLVNFFVIFVNFGLSLLINLLYVSAAEVSSYDLAMGVQICVSFFQIIWNFVVLPRFFYPLWERSLGYSDSGMTRNINLYWSAIVIINIVLIPCLATIGYSDSCIYGLLFKDSNDFQYSYECSSVILFTFSSQLIFQLSIITFAFPLMFLLLRMFYKLTSPTSRLHDLLGFFLPAILKPVDEVTQTLSLGMNSGKGRKAIVLFSKHVFFTTTASTLAVVLTFGVMFPLLGLVAGVSILILIHLLQTAVGFVLSIADDRENYVYRNALDADFADLADAFADILTILVPIVSAFYSLFVFDIIGRENGWQDGAAVAILMLLVPILLALFARFKGLCIPNYAKIYVEQQAKLLAVQTSYQKDLHKQFSPLARVTKSMKAWNSPDTISYNFRRKDDSPSPLAGKSGSPSLYALAITPSSPKKNMQLIDLENYVN